MKKKTTINQRLKIYGILGIIYSVYLIIDYFFITKNKWLLGLGIILLLASLIFLGVGFKWQPPKNNHD